jgi:rRNA biogenesis protein RRP5
MSKLKPITSYEDAVEGLVTHGFITGFEDYGCFVSFYNDVKGLAHRKDLGIDAGVKADTVFEVGQSIKCRVLRCDPASCRLSLSFVTSSHRGTDQEGEETGVKVGELVSGTVAHVADKVFILDVMTDKELMKGILTFPHLSDTSGHVEGLKGIIKVGHKLEQLLVLGVFPVP